MTAACGGSAANINKLKPDPSSTLFLLHCRNQFFPPGLWCQWIMIRRMRSRRPLEAGKFDYKYIGVNVGNIPLVGTGKSDHEVFELHLDEFI